MQQKTSKTTKKKQKKKTCRTFILKYICLNMSVLLNICFYLNKICIFNNSWPVEACEADGLPGASATELLVAAARPESHLSQVG